MFPRIPKTLVPWATVLLACVFADAAFTAAPDAPCTTRFFSRDGTVLAEDCEIEPNQLTFLEIHGHLAWARQKESLEQADAVCKRFPSANVFLPDWGPPSKPDLAQWTLKYGPPTGGVSLSWEEKWVRAIEYPHWTVHTRVAARDIVQWMKAKGVLPSSTVLVAHSLGAHLAAFVSNEAAKEEWFGHPVRAIIASDPAGPGFETNPPSPPEERLDENDATQVIVIHATEFPGCARPLGTLDIYIEWPDSIREEWSKWQKHAYAKKLVTDSFLDPDMSSTDGTPFGVNALDTEFAHAGRRTFRPDLAPESARQEKTVPVEEDGVITPAGAAPNANEDTIRTWRHGPTARAAWVEHRDVAQLIGGQGVTRTAAKTASM